MRKLAFLAAVVVAVASIPRDARAGDIETARRFFGEGVKLFERGDYEGARRLFKKADAEHHAAPIVYNLGLAEERTGHPQAAVDAYEAYVAEQGDAGELTSAAVIAVAQIKARSTRLRIETKPAGARLFVDASTLADASPATLLVTPGPHLVVAQGDGWRGEQELDAKGGGETLTIVISPAGIVETAAPAVPVVVPPAPPDVDRSAPPEVGKPQGFVWGASFALAPFHMEGATRPNWQNSAGATQAMAGAIVEVGHALNDRFEFLARGFVAVGPEGKPTYAWMGGPGISARVASLLWLGATFVGGQLETRAYDVPYGTDLVFGAMVETAVVILSSPAGQWTIGAQPGFLRTEDPTHNTAYFVPVTFGYRAY